MTAGTHMTALQMYAELVKLGLQPLPSSGNVYFTPPSNYQYVPTRLIYSSPWGDNAKLERSSVGSEPASRDRK
jgi:hypothetical protein